MKNPWKTTRTLQGFTPWCHPDVSPGSQGTIISCFHQQGGSLPDRLKPLWAAAWFWVSYPWGIFDIFGGLNWDLLIFLLFSRGLPYIHPQPSNPTSARQKLVRCSGWEKGQWQLNPQVDRSFGRLVKNQEDTMANGFWGWQFYSVWNGLVLETHRQRCFGLKIAKVLSKHLFRFISWARLRCCIKLSEGLVQ